MNKEEKQEIRELLEAIESKAYYCPGKEELLHIRHDTNFQKLKEIATLPSPQEEHEQHDNAVPKALRRT